MRCIWDIYIYIYLFRIVNKYKTNHCRTFYDKMWSNSFSLFLALDSCILLSFNGGMPLTADHQHSISWQVRLQILRCTTFWQRKMASKLPVGLSLPTFVFGLMATSDMQKTILNLHAQFRGTVLRGVEANLNLIKLSDLIMHTTSNI